MDLFTGWSDDFGDARPVKPKRNQGRITRRQPAPAKVPEIRLEDKKSVQEVVETPAGTVEISAVSAEYSVGNDVATIKTVDIDAENVDTGAELKIDTAVVSDNATGEVVAAAGVIEYTEPDQSSSQPVIKSSIPSDEVVPIKSSESYIDWVQKISGEGKKKDDKSKSKKDKKKKKSSKKQIVIEDETDLDRLTSVHSEGKMKQSVTISTEQDLDDFIDKQRRKQRANGQYGAYFDPSTNSLQEGGRPVAGVSVPFVSVHGGGRKIPAYGHKHPSGDRGHALDVSVPLTRVQVGDHYESSSNDLLDVSVPFTRLQVGGDKRPINEINSNEDMDAYVEEMMEMRNVAMGKKKNKKASKEGEYYTKAKQRYAKKEKFLILLNAHEKKALEDMSNIPKDQKQMIKRYDALVKYIQLTKKNVIKAKPNEIDAIYTKYRDDMTRIESSM